MNKFVRQDALLEGDIYVDEDGKINTVLSPMKDGELELIDGSYRDVRRLDHFTAKRITKERLAAEFPVLVLYRDSQ